MKTLIEDWLIENKLTMQDLSDHTNIKLDLLIKIINGESKLTAKRCDAISNATGISANDLLGYKPNEFAGYTLPFYESMNLSPEQYDMIVHLVLLLRQYDYLKGGH